MLPIASPWCPVFSAGSRSVVESKVPAATHDAETANNIIAVDADVAGGTCAACTCMRLEQLEDMVRVVERHRAASLLGEVIVATPRARARGSGILGILLLMAYTGSMIDLYASIVDEDLSRMARMIELSLQVVALPVKYIQLWHCLSIHTYYVGN
jgi:hypothetical protein